MATPTRAQAPVDMSLASEQLVRAYRCMYMAAASGRSRDRPQTPESHLFSDQRRGPRGRGSGGGPVFALRARLDFILYYRDRALCLTLGVTPVARCSCSSGRGGRSGIRRPADAFPLERSALNIVSSSSSTGTQFLQAVGCAEATAIWTPNATTSLWSRSGEGATSEGEFWEALNAAA